MMISKQKPRKEKAMNERVGLRLSLTFDISRSNSLRLQHLFRGLHHKSYLLHPLYYINTLWLHCFHKPSSILLANIIQFKFISFSLTLIKNKLKKYNNYLLWWASIKSYLRLRLEEVPSEWARLHLSNPSQLGPSFAMLLLLLLTTPFQPYILLFSLF